MARLVESIDLLSRSARPSQIDWPTLEWRQRRGEGGEFEWRAAGRQWDSLADCGSNNEPLLRAGRRLFRCRDPERAEQWRAGRGWLSDGQLSPANSRLELGAKLSPSKSSERPRGISDQLDKIGNMISSSQLGRGRAAGPERARRVALSSGGPLA